MEHQEVHGHCCNDKYTLANTRNHTWLASDKVYTLHNLSTSLAVSVLF